MVLTPITAARVTVACLAASLGWGNLWAKVQAPAEQPVSQAANDAGLETLHNSVILATEGVLATEKLLTAPALAENVVAEDAAHSSKAHVDGISTIETVQIRATLIESVADVSSNRRVELALQAAPIAEQSGAPKPWDELPFTEVVACFWGACSPLAWPIVASLPLDCLLMFFFFAWRKWRSCGKTADQSTAPAGLGDQSLNLDEEPEASHEVVPDLDEAVQGCAEVAGDIDVRTILATAVDQADVPPMPSLQQDDTVSSDEQKPTRRSTKSAGDLKVWMEKQRGLCETVENTQACVATDAKAIEGYAENALPVDAAPQILRNRSRSGAELKALMEKKRDECHVLESSQEHVNTDAKATGCSLKPGGKDDVATNKADMDSTLTAAAPARRCNTSSKEVKEWMSRLKNQCEVIEGPAPVFVETDAKSSARPVKGSPNKESIACVEEAPTTTESPRERVNTDAKATRCSLNPDGKNDVATLQVFVDSNLTAPPPRRCNTSSKDVKEWMSRLKNRCEVIEGPAPVFVETDAKSSAHPVKSSPNKENIDRGQMIA